MTRGGGVSEQWNRADPLSSPVWVPIKNHSGADAQEVRLGMLKWARKTMRRDQLRNPTILLYIGMMVFGCVADLWIRLTPVCPLHPPPRVWFQSGWVGCGCWTFPLPGGGVQPLAAPRKIARFLADFGCIFRVFVLIFRGGVHKKWVGGFVFGKTAPPPARGPSLIESMGGSQKPSLI